MRGLIAAAGTAFIFAIAGSAAAQACAAGTAKEINGNWYCSPVKAITYSNFPGTGSYKKVTQMNASSGECTQQRYTYSGSLSPLNEEVWWTPFALNLKHATRTRERARLTRNVLNPRAVVIAYSWAHVGQTARGLRPDCFPSEAEQHSWLPRSSPWPSASSPASGA